MSAFKEPENILYRISRNDQHAFDLFMARWTKHLYHYAMSMLQSKETVDEVVSDVFMQVWESRHKLLEIEYMGQWLRKITFNMAVSRLRTESCNPKFISLDDMDTFNIPPIEAPDATILSHEQQEAINTAMQKLPPKSKHVFFLAKIERMSQKEIASMLNISQSTVKYHVQYAMEQLRNILIKRIGNDA